MPRKKAKNKSADTALERLLLVQTLACVLLLLAVVASRTLMPPLYMWMQRNYAVWFEKDDLAPELARFAGAALDSISLPVYAAKAPPENASDTPLEVGQDSMSPVLHYTVSSPYGWRRHPVTRKQTYHHGVDLACAEGTPVMAAMAGIVEYTRYSSDAGNYLRLRHPDGVETVYCHMQYIFVRMGETVNVGQLLGTAGQTGNATGPHLHFSVLKDDIYYDPERLLQ